MVIIIAALIFHHGCWSTVHNETTTRHVGGISTAVMYCPSSMYSCTPWLQWKRLSFLLHAHNTPFCYQLCTHHIQTKMKSCTVILCEQKWFHFFLKMIVLSMEQMLCGSWFHALGAATRKARSSNNNLVHETNSLSVAADRTAVGPL